MDSRTYDQQGRLQSQQLGSIDNRSYSYDPNGNILQRSTTPQGSEHQHDKLDRITSDTIDSGTANQLDCSVICWQIKRSGSSRALYSYNLMA